MKKLFRSFKLRLFIVILTICVVTSIVLVSRIVSAYKNKLIEVKSVQVVNELGNMANYMLSKNYFTSSLGNTESVDERLTELASVYEGRVLVINSDFKIIYDSFDAIVGKYFTSKEIIECYTNGSVCNVTSANGFIEVAIPIIDSGISSDLSREPVGILFASLKLNDLNQTVKYVDRTVTTVELILILVVTILAIIFAFVLAYPFSKVTGQIKNFAAFDEGTIDTTGYIETEDIAIAFNELKVRLKVLDDSRQEFVSNVSHELKTPITSIKVLADSINEQDDVPNELYREFMQDIVDEIDRENSIITDLLSLVKLDKGDAALNITHVNVNEMLELVLKRLYPIADKNEVELIIDAKQDVEAEIDDVKMTLALTNLIENGIKYNVAGGWVNVILTADNQYMTIVIRDSGIGIAKEELDHIFERFYRVDKSHSREIGGTGLGLAIARKTILLHRGYIKVDSEIGAGTTFEVRIPLTYVGA